MASTTSATAAAAAFGAAATAKPRGSSSTICPRVSTGGRRRSGVVRCDASVEVQVQAVAKAASIAALEQFKISADRESLALRLSSNLQPLLPFLLLWMRDCAPAW
jgi:glutamyl-tRNA reductase